MYGQVPAVLARNAMLQEAAGGLGVLERQHLMASQATPALLADPAAMGLHMV